MIVILIGTLIKDKNSAQINASNCEINGFSILVPFKNEALRLPIFINSLVVALSQKNDVLVEVLFINDNSNDASVTIIQNFISSQPIQGRVLHLEKNNIGKKQAIQLGVEKAKYERIITIDADCEVGKDWFLECTKYNQELVIGMVVQKGNTSTLNLNEAMQVTEGLMLQFITLGSSNLNQALLCSGANLMYYKRDFMSLNPYFDNRDIASGDDMFLLEKFKNQSKSIFCNPNSIVYTNAELTFEKYIKRSIRWSSKTAHFKSKLVPTLALLVFITNSVFTLSWMICFFEGNSFIFFNCIIKFLVDFFILFLISMVLKKLYLLIFTPVIVFVYPIYLIWVAIGQFTYNMKHWS